MVGEIALKNPLKTPSTLWCSILLAGFILLPGHAAWAEPRTVKNASVQFITGDDGKDDTDVLTITVSNAAGKVLERVFAEKQEIKPGTTFTLWLTKSRAETDEALKDAKVTFRIQPKGDEHWVVKDAQLTILYENGPPDKWHWGPFVLETKASKPFQVEYTLSDDRRVR